MRWSGGRQKLRDGGDGKVQRSRSQGEWVVDGLCRIGWGGDLRRTGVVSRSFETDRWHYPASWLEGQRDRGRDGYRSREMSTSRHRSVTHTLTQMEKAHSHTNTQRFRTKESGVFESEKGRDEEITSCPLKIKSRGRKKETKQNKRQRVTDYDNNLAFIHMVCFTKQKLPCCRQVASLFIFSPFQSAVFIKA